jgi:CO dehydrogenase nickel-insertion accessory protein CooC1
LILNRVPGEIPTPLQEKINELAIPLIGTIPVDDTLMSFEFEGRPLVDLGDDSPVYQAVVGIMEIILA